MSSSQSVVQPLSVDDWLSAIQSDSSADGRRLRHILTERHGAQPDIISDRLDVMKRMLTSTHVRQGFTNKTFPVVCVASPGRDRLFMGHTDFAGLGGFTIDCACAEELVAFATVTDDGNIYLSNTDDKHFPLKRFSIRECYNVALDRSAYGRSNWSAQTDWSAYVKAALTFMLSARFDRYEDVRKAFDLPVKPDYRDGKEEQSAAQSTSRVGLRIHVSSSGLLSLPHTGGVSSSAALTGAISFVVSRLLIAPMSSPLTLDSHAAVDYGEYYLEKFAGAADKMAQLHAQRHRVTVIGSLPERLISSIQFPTEHIRLIIADNDIPRLTITHAENWLLNTRKYSRDHVDAVLRHSRNVMARFGSLAYTSAVDEAVMKLGNKNAIAAVGITPRQAAALIAAMKWKAPMKRLTTSTNNTENNPLLRELCYGGRLEVELPEVSGWNNRFKRYKLIYQMLKLISQKKRVENKGKVYDLTPRKAALYGLSEVERGHAYLATLERIVKNGGQKSDVSMLIHLVELSHDGDRAVVDYRRPRPASAGPHKNPHLDELDNVFESRHWAETANVTLTNSALDKFISSSADLIETVGSYERSIADVDDLADEVHKRFNGTAAVRISAAGLGGRVCCHCAASSFDAFNEFLKQRGWNLREPKPSSPTQYIALSQENDTGGSARNKL